MNRTKYHSTHVFSAPVGVKECKWCGRFEDVHAPARIRRAKAEITHSK